MYALFKQGSIGDVNTSRPGWTDLKGRAKWDAWCGKKGMSQERARRSYIDLISQLGILESCAPVKTAQAARNRTTEMSFEAVVEALRDPARADQVRAIPDMTKLDIYALFAGDRWGYKHCQPRLDRREGQSKMECMAIEKGYEQGKC